MTVTRGGGGISEARLCWAEEALMKRTPRHACTVNGRWKQPAIDQRVGGLRFSAQSKVVGSR